MQKILLYGGTFDPPHLGHLKMVQTAKRTLKPDLTFIIPSYQSPLKELPHAAAKSRKAMLRILFKGDRISNFELKRKRPTYTFETLRHFKMKYPNAELHFLIGSDSAAMLSKWKNQPELKRLCRWVIGRRPSDPKPSIPLGFAAKFLSEMMPDISSTDLRSRFFAGETTGSAIPPGELRFIRRRRLYGLDLHADLQRSLNPNRYAHTLGVARLARKLAETHRLNPEYAALAGLLHDCGRRFNVAQMAGYALRRDLDIPFRSTLLRKAPLISHAYISEDWSRREFGIRQPEVLSAIRNHTLGAVGMSKLDRLLYVADIAAENRLFPAVKRIQKAAMRDLDKAFLISVAEKKSHVMREGHWLFPATDRLLRWARSLAK